MSVKLEVILKRKWGFNEISSIVSITSEYKYFNWNKQTNKESEWVNQWNSLLIVFCVLESEFHFIWKWKNEYQTCEQFQIQFVIINLIHFLMWIDFNEFSEEFWSWIENHFVKLKWMSTVLHNQFHVWQCFFVEIFTQFVVYQISKHYKNAFLIYLKEISYQHMDDLVHSIYRKKMCIDNQLRLLNSELIPVFLWIMSY
jgi:hypothetical protein